MTKKSFLTILLLPALLISSVVCSAQDKPVKDNTKPASPPITTQNIKAPLAFGLEDGTPIKIRITRTISFNVSGAANGQFATWKSAAARSRSVTWAIWLIGVIAG